MPGMRYLLALALLLTGCPGAMLAGAAAQGEPRPYVHPPNKSDLASWVAEPQASLETHARLSRMPREVRRNVDGSEAWSLRHCPPTGDCCMFHFAVRASVVATYRTTCDVDCSMRPDAKVQACVDAARVPDGFH